MEDIDPALILPDLAVIDFGQSFDAFQRPPPVAFGIPANYAAPVVIFDNVGSTAMDLWSLGCTIYEMYVGRQLFDVFQLIRLTKLHYLDEIDSLLGPPPDPWAAFYRNETEEERETETDHQQSGTDGNARPGLPPTRLIHDKLVKCRNCTGKDCAHPVNQLITEVEAATLAELLEKLLRYSPSDRLSVKDALGFSWLNI